MLWFLCKSGQFLEVVAGDAGVSGAISTWWRNEVERKTSTGGEGKSVKIVTEMMEVRTDNSMCEL